jgi:FkbM family methyltransferase
MVSLAPQGRHFAFEPLPEFTQVLRHDFPGVEVVEAAAAEAEGTDSFRYVRSDPGWSSLARLPYNPMDEEVSLITVKTVRLDDALPSDLPIHFIKVDVNGAEIRFFEGAVRTLSTWRPVVAFELGWGPEEVHAILARAGLAVSLLDRWLSNQPALTRDEFLDESLGKHNWFFVAYPQS